MSAILRIFGRRYRNRPAYAVKGSSHDLFIPVQRWAKRRTPDRACHTANPR
jgi:hypothetical protein